VFTICDICDIAVQIERNGEAGYRRAAQIAPNQEIGHILTWMADEEHRHAGWFEKIAIEQTTQADHGELEAMGRALLQNMVKDQTFDLQSTSLGNALDTQSVIAQFIEFENDTIIFYDMLSGFIEDDAVRRQLALIIKEERGHVLQLERLKAASLT
jgi:rubrerythrin